MLVLNRRGTITLKWMMYVQGKKNFLECQGCACTLHIPHQYMDKIAAALASPAANEFHSLSDFAECLIRCMNSDSRQRIALVERDGLMVS